MFEKVIEIFYGWFEKVLTRHSKYFMMGPYTEGPYNRDYDNDNYNTLSN